MLSTTRLLALASRDERDGVDDVDDAIDQSDDVGVSVMKRRRCDAALASTCCSSPSLEWSSSRRMTTCRLSCAEMSRSASIVRCNSRTCSDVALPSRDDVKIFAKRITDMSMSHYEEHKIK